MNRIVIVVLAAAVVGFVAVAVSPATLIPLAVVMIAAVAWWARQNRPFDAQQPAHRWYGWLGGGAAMIAIGFAIPAIEGGELHSGWWTVFALALLTGTAMILTAVILAVNGQSPRSEGPTH